MMNKQAGEITGATWCRAVMSIVAVLLVACLIALSGCGSGTKAAATLSEALEAETATAIVTAVDGNQVTVNVMDDSQMPGMGQGEPPAQPGGQDNTGSAESTATTETDPSNQVQDDAGTNSDADSAPAGEPPAMPEGDAGAAPNGEPPALPEGAQPGGQPPAMPDSNNQASSDGSTEDTETNAPEMGGDMGMMQMGGTEMTLTIDDGSIVFVDASGQEVQGSLSSIEEGMMLQLSVQDGTTVTKIVASKNAMGGGMGAPADMGSAPGGQQGGPGSGSGTVSNGTGATTFTTDGQSTGESFDSTATDENAVRVECGSSVQVANATITKTGDSSSSEDSDFYGLNAAVLAYDGSNLDLSGATISTDSKGSNGVFAYGEGTAVTVSDTTIRCTQGNSGGIEVAGGASLTANNLDIDTQGESSAAIRSDRGGGTEIVNGGTYTTHGKHSPAVYCTADVTVNDATLTAENCEGVVIEGKNSVALNNCTVTGNVNNVATRTGVVNNVMIYQSMSGDASEGTGNFSMTGGSFEAANGTLFYVTNTDAVITMEGVDVNNAGRQLLVAAGNDRWGTEGSNGGSVTFTAVKQALAGAITVDAISSLDFSLDAESSYTGAINADGQAGTVNVTLAEGATWTLDADSYVTSLSGSTAGINLNGHTLYVNGEPFAA